MTEFTLFFRKIVVIIDLKTVSFEERNIGESDMTTLMDFYPKLS